MGNDRSQILLRALLGGLLAGTGLSLSGVWWMLPALALLWSVAMNPLAAALWGALAVAISHRWLLALHPLTWLGVPELLSLPLAAAVWLGCVLAAALLLSGWSGLVRLLPGRGGALQALVLSLIWGLGETLLSRSPLFWIGVGGSVFPADPALGGLARWCGAGGLAALQLLLGWWLWTLLASADRGRMRLRLLGIGAVGLALLHALGVAALVGIDRPDVSRDPLNLALWQPAIPTREKFSAERQSQFPRLLRAALTRAEAEGSDLLIAPEGTLPLDRGNLLAEPVPLISGGFRWVAGRQRSALLLLQGDDATPAAVIDKHRLVPLGEWTPALPGLAGLSAVGGLEPGEASRLWRWGGPPVQVAICYEISNGTALAQAAARGGQWILTAANLDPYPLLLQHQFLALAQLRSVETARPLVSAANTGPTAAINAQGEVTSRLTAMRPGVLTVQVQPSSVVTPYARLREWPLVGLLLIAAATLLRLRSGSVLPPEPRHRRKTPPPGQA